MPKPKPITLRTKKADIQKELKRHGVEFEQSALKADLISLYQSEVLGKAPQFSSDDEDSIATISKSTMTMRSVKEEQLQGESVVVLESLLNQMQDDSGDAVVRRSPRKRKKPLRFMEDIESQTNQLTVSLARIDGMDGEDVSSFTNKKLMAELKKRGARVGPVGPTTRKIYERKLMKLMAGEKEEAAALDHSDEGSSEEEVEVARTPVTRRRRETAVKEEYTDSATKRRPLHQKSPKAETSVKEPVVPAPSAGEQAVKARSRVPWWVKIGVVLIVAVFLYFVYVSMEENSRKLLFMKTK